MAKGGARPGAGRPTKADEEKVKGLAISAIEKKFGSIEAGFQKLLESEEPSLIKFVWEHAVGKPREKMDLDVEGGLNIVWNETRTYETKQHNESE